MNRYVIERQLGKGGVGAVYEASDRHLDVTVAVKHVQAGDSPCREAVRREALLLNRLRHPALPRVTDYFEDGDDQYFVMEFVPGSDLERRLAEQGSGFDAREVLVWVDEILSVLEYLHSHTPPIVHRDVKPSNLKLDLHKRIVVLDFGLAKGAAEGLSIGSSVYGYTPHYAPFEQIQGHGTDPRSDIYGLGATAFRLLTGVRPPDALDRASALLRGHADPLVSAWPPETPALLQEVLSRALALHPEGRFLSAAAFREALRGLAVTGAPPLVDGSADDEETRVRVGSLAIRESTDDPRQRAERLAEVERLESQLAERELEIATLRAKLRAFESLYLARVGRLYAHLDRVNAAIAAEIAASAPDDAALAADAKRAQQRADATDAELDSNEPVADIFAPSAALKKLYREVVRLVHPDRAADDRERDYRHELMVDAVRAYEAGDDAVLADLLEEAKLREPAAKGCAFDLLGRQIERIRRRLVAIETELAALRGSELFELWAEAAAAEGEGRDLIADLVSCAAREVERAGEELAGLRDARARRART